MKNGKKVYAIVLAGGRGTRMGSDVPKQYLMLKGRPVIAWSLQAFEDSEADAVVLVTGEGDQQYCRQEIVERYGFRKVSAIVAGGKERFHSVENGLEQCADAGYVLIHDGARPMVTPKMIHDSIECAAACRACVCAVPSKDTVKLADGEGYVSATPDRSRVWIIQTPQTFEYELIREAGRLRRSHEDNEVTDDAMMVEKYMDVRVKLLMGDYRNIKLTTPEDLIVLERLMG